MKSSFPDHPDASHPDGAMIYGVDAFTSVPFRGNPAAVCLLERPAPAEWMQKVASEMNLSETAFVVRETDGWSLRWFAPLAEVALCGHATLASAHVLWQSGRVPMSEAIRFRTEVSGILTCVREDSGVVMDFPSRPPVMHAPPPGLLESLQCVAVWTGKTVDDWFVEVADASEVMNLRPDMGGIAKLPGRGVVVTARGGPEGYDFVSRFFAPSVGVPEDPVTGSTHASLGPYWGDRLGRDRVRGWQASSRGGDVWVRRLGGRVELVGEAVVVWRGELSMAGWTKGLL